MDDFQDKNIDDIENIEIDLLLEAIYRLCGYDFRDYSKSHIKRRIRNFAVLNGYSSLSVLQHDIIHNTDVLNRVLKEFSINVTEMFRDPFFYLFLKDEVLPVLESYPYIKIWNAGCSSGEEVYSIAILLYEAGLLERCQIYATDFNDNALHKAKDGIYRLADMQTYTKNYHQAGGIESFSEYYQADDESAIIKTFLRNKIVFANHNLVSDSVFGKMQLILCRNVLIYFNDALQQHVLKLFDASLGFGGFLCLGTKESISFSDIQNYYSEVDSKVKIYKKILTGDGLLHV